MFYFMRSPLHYVFIPQNLLMAHEEYLISISLNKEAVFLIGEKNGDWSMVILPR